MTKFEETMHLIATKQRPPLFSEEWGNDAKYIVVLGGHLTTETLLEAYSKGFFPWTGQQPIPWHSPDPRMILLPEKFKSSRSLRKLRRQNRFTIRFDHDFRGVMEACAHTPRFEQKGTWITSNMIEAYTTLHELYIAHSVEVYDDQELCGGLYGITLGRAFFGESMFFRRPNASKLALYALSLKLQQWNFDFIDCQQETSHLFRLGGFSVPRKEYLERLHHALQSPSRHYSWTSIQL